MDLHPEDIIISIINITVLFILLRLILWKHVIRFLAQRADRVRREMDSVEKSREEAESLRSEYDKKLGEIEAHGQELIRESKLKAKGESEKILSETRDKAREMLNDAEARIAEEKEQALEEVSHEVAQLATDMAARILGRDVLPEDNTNAVDDFFRDREDE